MATDCSLILSTIFSFSILLNFPRLTISDGACPYPCYPPPTGSGTPAVTTPPPPSPTQQTGSFPPPAGYYPSPAGNYPFNNPPPGSNFGSGPPPPDPILPYFPFYYRKPPHGTESSSATISCQRSTSLKFLAFVLLLFLWLM